MTREKAIKELRDASDDEVRYGDTEHHYNEVMKRIEAFDMAIKALEEQTKTGHWIMTGDYYTGAYDCIDYVECSCCHEESLEEGNYCPNYGARMTESEEKE